MRIAVNTRFLLPGRLEGIGWYTYEVLRRMVAAHPEVEFLFLFDRPYDSSFLFGPNVTAKVIPPPARHPFLWWLWFELAVPMALKRWKPDVFFSPDTYLSLRTKVPTVMVAHDLAYAHYPEQIPGLARRYYAHFTPKYLAKATQVITVSDFVKRDILAHYSLPPAKIAVVPNACRPGFFPLSEAEQKVVRQRWTGGQPYWIYIGAIHPRKNVPQLIEAFNAFKEAVDSPVQLVLAGRFAWQSGPVKAAYENSPFKDAIQFTGYVEEEELPRLLGAALGLVYVSVFEGFGLPVLEAMECEVPVITSNVSSLPEVAGEAALLVDPKDTAAIAGAMRRLWQDRGLRERLISKGRQQRALFSWDHTAAAVFEILQRVVEA